jgi:hypothetical protein
MHENIDYKVYEGTNNWKKESWDDFRRMVAICIASMDSMESEGKRVPREPAGTSAEPRSYRCDTPSLPSFFCCSESHSKKDCTCPSLLVTLK